MLAARAAHAPDATAFIAESREISRAEFLGLCARAASWLTEQGVVPGDRVAIWMVNRLEWLALFFATLKLGAILVPVNTRYRAEEVSYILKKSGASLLCLQSGFRKIDFADILRRVDGGELPRLKTLAVLDAVKPMDRILRRTTVELAIQDSVPDTREDTSDPEAPAIIFTTSGTTRGPKLVMHPQRTLRDHAERCVSAYQLNAPGTVVLAMLPFCGVFGLNVVLAALAAGVPAVLVDAFDGPVVASLMNRYRVTHTYGSDEMVHRLAEALPGHDPFPALRFFGFGAFNSSFGDSARQAWERRIPLYGLYGSSEVLAIFAAQKAGLPVPECIKGGGYPVAGRDASVRVRDIDTGRLLSPGEVGELEIRGPSNFIGYYQDADATARAVDGEGYFKTGDLGHLRADGSFVYQSRQGDVIRLGGFLVNPLEIEEAIKQIDGVADAQVAAIDIQGTNRVVAFVIERPRAGLSEASLIDQIALRVAAFKVPARIAFVSRYPVTESSNGVKTQRAKLRDMARALVGESTH
ncbi:AMP-binding protein [Castellaniella sp.]|uniref:AMP-binding protein n=1 Tax=Castellaniella sp. TaxID=1955812 RepID=UPI002AFEE9AC|nr:AMP-binding protein [Castellaniella sp.]